MPRYCFTDGTARRLTCRDRSLVRAARGDVGSQMTFLTLVLRVLMWCIQSYLRTLHQVTISPGKIVALLHHVQYTPPVRSQCTQTAGSYPSLPPPPCPWDGKTGLFQFILM